MMYFNELNVDLNDSEHFPPTIFERTKQNPHDTLSIPCVPCNDSLDEYSKKFINELFIGLGIKE